MNFFHRRLLSHVKPQTFKYLHYSLAPNPANFGTQFPTKPLQSQHSKQDPSKTIATHLSNCSSLQELNQIYAHVIRTHFLDIYTAPLHWNNLIRCYTRLDAPSIALQIYVSMSHAGISPDNYTLPIVLKAACQCFAMELGRQLHSIAIRLGLELNEYCESGFISLYSKSGDLGNAYKVFEENLDRKLGSWNAIIGGLCQGGRAKEVIEMFMEMRRCGFKPDDVTMVSVTAACGILGDLQLALQLHKCVFQAKSFAKSDILMLNSLVDMYGKCGRMDLAYMVFSRMDQRNVSSWTSMIVGYAMHGRPNEAIECFSCMRDAGMGEWVAKHLLDLEPWNDGVYVVLSNIYASRGLWLEVERVRLIMKQRTLAKIPAYSLATTSN
ncbi:PENTATRICOPEPTIDE REPEAT (PPR) SUPERFAMILY PROTEIN [Salix koriyanagi]|uniref:PENTATRICOPEPTIDE REPEAT (PPR) SUPERFAMILY PROTEIN n=1 Tax=Salix koriyanagi TaxID=2511006 RepID=A0A9Q0VF69_9ROSI|nr:PENTATRICOPEPTIDE REPEAT (PPR) SUPERFAMILY PROTEIN [Salix koriyanagi]